MLFNFYRLRLKCFKIIIKISIYTTFFLPQIIFIKTKNSLQMKYDIQYNKYAEMNRRLKLSMKFTMYMILLVQ